MSKPETISFHEFFQEFPDEEAARLFFEGKRWPDGVECPHCESQDISECKGHKPMPYRCKTCRKHFSVRVGMVLAESRLPLHKWLMAIYMMTTARKGIPSTQMARELGITLGAPPQLDNASTSTIVLTTNCLSRESYERRGHVDAPA